MCYKYQMSPENHMKICHLMMKLLLPLLDGYELLAVVVAISVTPAHGRVLGFFFQSTTLISLLRPYYSMYIYFQGLLIDRANKSGFFSPGRHSRPSRISLNSPFQHDLPLFPSNVASDLIYCYLLTLLSSHGILFKTCSS